MKAVICLWALVVVAVARPEDKEDKYTTKYDGVNVPEILSNKRVFHPYIDCALDKGKCTNEAKELKIHIGEALKTYCAKCSEKQKENIKLVIAHLINHEPEYWQQLCDKYDPDRIYAVKYEKELKTVSCNNKTKDC